MSRGDTDAAAATAMLGAAVMIAYQVAAKATQKSLFLNEYTADAVSLMIMGAALFSIVLAALASRAMAAAGPARLAPPAFIVSAALHVAEWLLWGRAPKAVAIILYLHVAGLGAMLISGFWSLVNERFDPHTAKKRIAQITAAGTPSALVGGAIAWVVGEKLTTSAMLPVLCVMHLMCGCILWPLGARGDSAHGRSIPAAGGLRAGTRLIHRRTYLQDLACVVFIGAACGSVLDVVLMSRTQAVIDPAHTLRFFAFLQTAATIVNCAVQFRITNLMLERTGLGITAGTHPATIAIGSLGAALIPGVGSVAAARTSEQVIRNSLFRAAYELFYTPLPPDEKRCVKPLIDVGFERLGDMAGAAVSRGALLVIPAIAQVTALCVAAAAGLVGIWVARRLDRGYVAALERSLRDQVLELNLEQITDHTTRATLLRSSAAFPASARPSERASVETPPAPSDPLVRRIIELRSGDPIRVRQALEAGPIDAALAPHVIGLLGWDDVANDAARALRAAGAAITGQLLDTLLDGSTDFAVRRRIPRLLAALPSGRTLNGLLAGLGDKRFEVRYRCGRSLNAIVNGESALKVNPETVMSVVSRELDVDRLLWESHRLLDSGEEDQLLGARADRGLQHVFTLLSLILPKEPLRISLYALHTGDEMLRGTALEYLETVLPAEIRERLWPLVDDKRPKDRVPRDRDEVLTALLESHESIQAKLQQLQARAAHQA